MTTDDPKTERQDHIVLGMAAAAGAFFMFTVMNVFAKLLSENHSVVEIAFYRNLIATIPFLIAIFALGDRDILVIRSQPWTVTLRAIFGAISLSITFAAFSLMPMAETTALLFTSSLFIPVLGFIILRERVGPYRWSAVLIGFAGVLVMVQPAGNVYLLGVIVALCASLMHAGLQVALRFLGGHERPETVTFYFFLIGMIMTALPLPFIANRPTVDEIPLLLGLGLSGAAGQWLLSTAFKNAPAAVVTVFNYSGIVWATLFGWLIWSDWPLPAVLGGAVVVIASNFFIVWRERRLGKRVRVRPPESGAHE